MNFQELKLWVLMISCGIKKSVPESYWLFTVKPFLFVKT